MCFELIKTEAPVIRQGLPSRLLKKSIDFFDSLQKCRYFCAAQRHKSPRFARRKPCCARQCGAFDPIRGGRCPLELPRLSSTFCSHDEGFFDKLKGAHTRSFFALYYRRPPPRPPPKLPPERPPPKEPERPPPKLPPERPPPKEPVRPPPKLLPPERPPPKEPPEGGRVVPPGLGPPEGGRVGPPGLGPPNPPPEGGRGPRGGGGGRLGRRGRPKISGR